MPRTGTYRGLSSRPHLSAPASRFPLSPGSARRRRRRAALLSVHGRRIHRQLDVEGATLAFGAVYPDSSPVSLDYELAESETESRAARAWSSWHLDLSEF